MGYGNFKDYRKALDTLFPGKRAYMDDTAIVFGASTDQRTRGLVEIPQPGVWEVTTINRDGSKGEVRRIDVPSATPLPAAQKLLSRDAEEDEEADLVTLLTSDRKPFDMTAKLTRKRLLQLLTATYLSLPMEQVYEIAFELKDSYLGVVFDFESAVNELMQDTKKRKGKA